MATSARINHQGIAQANARAVSSHFASPVASASTTATATASTIDAVRVEERHGRGRVLVATRAFLPGDIIMHEQPVVVAADSSGEAQVSVCVLVLCVYICVCVYVLYVCVRFVSCVFSVSNCVFMLCGYVCVYMHGYTCVYTRVYMCVYTHGYAYTCI